MIYNFINFLKSKAKQEQKSLKKGFTMVELIIVLAIGALFILAAIGYFSYINKAKDDATRQKLAMLDLSLERYKMLIGKFPGDLNELVEGPTDPNLKRRKWGEPIANEEELKDAWGNPFGYEVDSKGTKYELYSTGSKGTSRTLSPASAEV